MVYVIIGGGVGVFVLSVLVQAAMANAAFDELLEQTYERAFHYSAKVEPAFRRRCIPSVQSTQSPRSPVRRSSSLHSDLELPWIAHLSAVANGSPAIKVFGAKVTFLVVLRFFTIQLTAVGLMLRFSAVADSSF